MIIHVVQEGAFGSMLLMFKEHDLAYTTWPVLQPNLNQTAVNHTIVLHCDDLSIGPLCDVDNSLVPIRNRFWHQMLVAPYISEKINLGLLAFGDNFTKLLTTATKVVFWYGYNAQELLLARRVAWYLRNSSNIEVSEAVLPEEYFTDFQGSFAMVPHEKLWDFYQCHKIVDINRLKAWAQEWEIMRSNAVLNEIRIWRNNQLEIVPETFYDNALLEMIGKDWKRAARVVGEVMSKSPFSIGDTWLFWRLRHMINIGQLEIQGNSETDFTFAYIRRIVA